MTDELSRDESVIHDIYNKAMKLQRKYGRGGQQDLRRFEAGADEMRKEYPSIFCEEVLGAIRGACKGELRAIPPEALTDVFLKVWRFHRSFRSEALRCESGEEAAIWERCREAAEKIRHDHGESIYDRQEVSSLLCAAKREIEATMDTLEERTLDSFPS